MRVHRNTKMRSSCHPGSLRSYILPDLNRYRCATVLCNRFLQGSHGINCMRPPGNVDPRALYRERCLRTHVVLAGSARAGTVPPAVDRYPQPHGRPAGMRARSPSLIYSKKAGSRLVTERLFSPGTRGPPPASYVRPPIPCRRPPAPKWEVVRNKPPRLAATRRWRWFWTCTPRLPRKTRGHRSLRVGHGRSGLCLCGVASGPSPLLFLTCKQPGTTFLEYIWLVQVTAWLYSGTSGWFIIIGYFSICSQVSTSI
jgi:hypothetical protein